MRAIKSSNVWLLSLAQGCHLAAALTAVSVVSLVGLKIAPSPSMATIPNAMLTIGVALSTIPLSFFMKNKSRKSGFLLGALLGLFSFSFGVAAVYSESFVLLCVASLLQGGYQASVLYYRYAAAEAVGEARQKSIAISIVLAGSLFAAFLAPSGAHYLNMAFMPFQYLGAYVFMQCMALLAFIPLLFLKPTPIEEEKSEGAERPLWDIIKQPKTICAISTTMAAWATMVLMMSSTPIAMKHEGFMYEHSTMVIQWHVLGMYAPSLFSGYLISRFGSLKVLFAGLFTLALAVLGGFLGHEFINFAMALILLGVGWNFLFVGATTLLTETHKASERAKVQGINEFMGFAVSALAAAASGAIIVFWGWDSMLLLEAIILAFTFGVTLWYSLSKQHRASLAKMEFE